MVKDRVIGNVTGPGGTPNPNLYVEAGETVVLAPDSQRFAGLYKRLTASSIDEVRSILGLSDAAGQALNAKGSCQRTCVPTPLHSPEDLSSEDRALRRRAKEVAVKAAYQYVFGANQDAFVQWKPLIDRDLQLAKIPVNYLVLQDIDIQNGGALVIFTDENALYTANIT